MDPSQVVSAIVYAIIGAVVLLLVYFAARIGAYDGYKDVDAEERRGSK